MEFAGVCIWYRQEHVQDLYPGGFHVGSSVILDVAYDQFMYTTAVESGISRGVSRQQLNILLVNQHLLPKLTNYVFIVIIIIDNTGKFLKINMYTTSE